MNPARRQLGGVGAAWLLAAGSLGSVAWTASAEMRVVPADTPITLEPVERLTEHGPIRGWAATVDLSDPAIDVVVSDLDGDADLDDADVELVEGAEVILTPMDSFVNRTGVALAFNANFFSWKEDAAGNKAQADIIGLSVSDGEFVSDFRRGGQQVWDPVLLFRTAGGAAALRPASVDQWTVPGFTEAVAGIGPSDTSEVPGTLLVEDGENLGETARVAPTKRHPRTAAGVSEDGKTLYVLVIDGRQFGHSVGATLPEMADLLIEMGADDAVALDGGGSSSLIGRARFLPEHLRELADPDGDGWVTNRPSDGRYRPIANQVGIRWSQAGKYGALPTFVPGAADVWSAGRAGLGAGDADGEMKLPVSSGGSGESVRVPELSVEESP
ncbi:MAG: phosphodiester glycosidase family protein [Planctomycetota bacterium]